VNLEHATPNSPNWDDLRYRTAAVKSQHWHRLHDQNQDLGEPMAVYQVIGRREPSRRKCMYYAIIHCQRHGRETFTSCGGSITALAQDIDQETFADAEQA
jgi:hypothetical protein